MKIYHSNREFMREMPKNGEIYVIDFRNWFEDSQLFDNYPFRVEKADDRVIANFADEKDAIQYAEWLEQRKES